MRALMFLGLSYGGAALAQEGPSPDDVARAKELFAEGRALYDEARYEEAVAALQEAYRLAPTPGLLYNVASPLERLGRWQEALDALKGYRPSAKQEELQGVDRRITALELKVAQERADAEALANAQQQAAATKVRKGPPAGAWVLYGVGAAGVGTGAIFTARALSARGQWTDSCPEGELRLCPADSADLVKRDRSSSVVADVSWLVGLGAAGAGVVVTLGGKKSSDLAVGANPHGVWLQGAF